MARALSHGSWQFCLAAILAVALRAWLLWQYGILNWPDSGGYIGFADFLLNVPSISDFLAGKVPVSGFRTIGYPLVLAVMMAIAGPAWEWATVCFQIILLLWMMWWLYRLGLAIRLGMGFSAFAAGVFATSHLAFYEGSILTDAIATHLTVIAVAVILVPLVEGRLPGTMRSLAAGLLVAFVVLVREATLYLVPVLVLALVTMALARRYPAGGTARMALWLVLPPFLIWQAYLGWTEVRTGYRAMASVGQSVYLLHPLDIEKRGRRVLQEPHLREAADATNSSYTYGHALEINSYLKSSFGLNEWERSELSKAAYWAAWRTAPHAMLGEAIRELRPKHAVRLADMSASFIDANVTVQMAEQSLNTKNSRWVRLLQLPFRVFSALVFAGCVLGVPAYIFIPRLRRTAPPALDALAVCWLLFASMTGMYAMIHMEFRHILPVQGFAVFSGLAVLHHIVRAHWPFIRR